MKRLFLAALLIVMIFSAGNAQKPDDVVIPWSEFLKLWDASRQTEAKIEQPPVDVLLTRAEYRAQLMDKLARIEAEMDITILKSGWVTIDLLPKETPISQAKMDGKPITLTISGASHQLISQQTGSHRLTFVIEVPIQRDQGPDYFQFACAQTPITIFKLEASDPTAEFKIEGSDAFTRMVANGRVSMEKTLSARSSIRVEWTKPVQSITSGDGKKPLVYSDLFTLISIGEGVMNCHSTVRYQILQAGIDQFQFAIPNDSELIDVRGRAVRDWEKQTEGDQTIVTVYLSFKVQDNFDLTVQYEKKLAGTSAEGSVPVLSVRNVERSKGFIGVEALTNVEITEKQSDLARLDVKELPSTVVNMTQNPILLAFKYLQTPFNLILSVKKHEDLAVLIATVDDAEIVSLATAEGRTVTHCKYWVRNNRKQFMKLNLPEGAQVWSTYVSDSPVKPAKNEDGQLLLPLRKSDQLADEVSTFPVELIYLIDDVDWGKSGTYRTAIPKIDIPISQLRWSLYTPDTYKFDDFTGTINDVENFATRAPSSVSRYSSVSPPDRQRMQERNITQVQSNVAGDSPLSGADRQIVVQQSLGSLPVRVNVPQLGKLHRFEKLLILEDDLRIEGKFKEK